MSPFTDPVEQPNNQSTDQQPIESQTKTEPDFVIR